VIFIFVFLLGDDRKKFLAWFTVKLAFVAMLFHVITMGFDSDQFFATNRTLKLCLPRVLGLDVVCERAKRLVPEDALVAWKRGGLIPASQKWTNDVAFTALQVVHKYVNRVKFPLAKRTKNRRCRLRTGESRTFCPCNQCCVYGSGSGRIRNF
jgi:hypothetical protein